MENISNLDIHQSEEHNIRISSKNRYLKSILEQKSGEDNIFKSNYESNAEVPQFNSFTPKVIINGVY